MALVHQDATTSRRRVPGRSAAARPYWGREDGRQHRRPGRVSSRPSPSAFAPCGYAGAQLQGAYGVTQAIAGGNDGSGVTVAVIDAFASPTAASDLARYSKDHGLAAPKLTEQVAPGIYNHPTTKK